MNTIVKFDHSHATLRGRAVAALKSGLKWRHHGIGVLQAYISENADVEHRLHIWSRSLLKPGIDASGDAHDHRFDMVSHVLFGTLAHEEWIMTPSLQGTWASSSLVNARQAGEEHNYHGAMTPTGERFVRQVKPFEIHAGSVYHFPARCFHRSPVSEFAITWIEKHNQSSNPARIVHPIDIPPVAAFGHDIDMDHVDRLASLAIEVLSA